MLLSQLQLGDYTLGFVSDSTRFGLWVETCNNVKVRTCQDEMAIYKRYRICRRHFDTDSMNGGCRRLLKTAVPTLHLNWDAKEEYIDDDADDILIQNEPESEQYLILPNEERPKANKANICKLIH